MTEDRPNIFDICKEISAKLSSLPEEEKGRALRWVAESLGVSLSSAAVPSSPSHQRQEAASDRAIGPSPVPAKDIRAFIEEKCPTSDVQYAVVVAYYYRFEAPEPERHETITPELLQKSTRLAGRKRFEKPRVPLNNAVTLGYLDRADKGQFSINAVGENLVAMTLPGKSEETAKKRKTKERSPGKASKSKISN